MQNYRSGSVEHLMQAISAIESPEECLAFMEDLCTIKELQDMAQRLETAILLDKGYSYQRIAEQVGISTATISRVSRSLNYGSGGYKKAIERLSQTEENNEDQ